MQKIARNAKKIPEKIPNFYKVIRTDKCLFKINN
jgi:hypothetical protein